MTGLAPKTLKVFNSIAQLSCIKNYVLVGGTALSLQINHRLSEDLDFCKWVESSSASNGIDFKKIEKELKKFFPEVLMNPLDFEQVDFLVNKEMKLQFFNEVGYTLPTKNVIHMTGNLKIAPLVTIAAMKIKTMFQRSAFRDYYDVYSLVKGRHIEIQKLIAISCTYNKKLSPQMIVNRLTMHKKFREEKNFGILSPKYHVSSVDIGAFFRESLKI